MPLYKMHTFEIKRMNAIFNLSNTGGLVRGPFAAAGGSVGNAMGIYVEMMEKKAKTGHRIDVRLSRAEVFKIAGPLLGLGSNKFINLGLGCDMLGLSAVSLSAAVIAGGPAGIFLAALALFGHAIGYGAVEAGFDISLGRSVWR